MRGDSATPELQQTKSESLCRIPIHPQVFKEPLYYTTIFLVVNP